MSPKRFTVKLIHLTAFKKSHLKWHNFVGHCLDIPIPHFWSRALQNFRFLFWAKLVFQVGSFGQIWVVSTFRIIGFCVYFLSILYY